MPSAIVVVTAIEAGFGFLLTSTVLYLVLSRGRKVYHYLFAALLLICAIWDLGICLMMIRNKQVAELVILGRISILLFAMNGYHSIIRDLIRCWFFPQMNDSSSLAKENLYRMNRMNRIELSCISCS